MAGNPTYYVEDLLGTSRVLTTNTGIVCYDADFYPFGGERAYTNTCPQNYKFEGKERDTETLNDDFGARYYSNRFGRWLSADWSSVPVPVPYAVLSNPQTLNLYAMVSDDPESFADLDGHWCLFGIVGATCTQPPPPPPPPKPPKLKGVNPVDGTPGFTRDPKGKPGHERPGAVDGSGRYGARRPANPSGIHLGEDVSGVADSSLVHSSINGNVIFSGTMKGYGKTIIVDDGNGTTTLYAHNSFNDVRAGSPVFEGEIIGLVGQTGLAQGQPPSEAHVHFEVKVNGVRVDPAVWLNTPVSPP